MEKHISQISPVNTNAIHNFWWWTEIPDWQKTLEFNSWQ